MPELTDLLQQTWQQQVPDYLLLRRAISCAKASYWKERIEHATLPTDAFALARWHMIPQLFRRAENQVICRFAEHVKHMVRGLG